MSRTKATVALLAAAFALGACASTGSYAGAEPNRGLDSLNQPIVQRSEYVIDLNAGAGGLAAGERERLDAWFASLGLGYGDRVWVEEGYAGEARQDVARVAADYGLLVSEGAPVTAGAVQPETVRVIVGRSTAHVPNCPNWSGVGGPSATSPNYGCAVNSNLAAMIADPSDLVLGQEGSGTDASTASKAIRVYRQAAPSGTQGLTDSSQKGND